MAKVEPFEKYTSRYDEWFERNRFAYESELQAVRSMLPEQGIGIEIGVGTGRFAKPLGIKFGIEPSMSMGKVARRRGINVIRAIAEALPIKGELFEIVLMITVICFVDNLETALREGSRVLKSGGVIIIGFIDRASSIGATYQVTKSENVFHKEANFYTPEEVGYYLKKVGFRDISFVQTIFRDSNEIGDIEELKEGYGEGSFVVARGVK
ncbi:MAG: class I SAM-dependent methyltransferase [Thermodesulfobacteriota bacterium]